MKVKHFFLTLVLASLLSACNYLSESANPTKYLTAGGSCNKNFWGNKLKIHGTIKNTAKSTTFKDAVIKVSYYSKTNTVLHTANYTIYEFFPPDSEKPFELKVDNYTNTERLGWEVVKATGK